MLDTCHWFRGEGFNLIVEGILGLPTDVPVIAEGFQSEAVSQAHPKLVGEGSL